MADAPDKESKTEEATEKKIRDTIEKGKLPHSRETAIFTSFVAILLYVNFYAKDASVDLGVFLSMFLEKPEDWPMNTEADVIALYKDVMMEIGRSVISLLVLLVVAGIGSSVFQNMPQFVGERITPQMSRISLSQGWKRLFGVQGFVEFLKSLAKVGIAILVLVLALSDDAQRLLEGMITSPVRVGLVIRGFTIDILDR